MWLTAVIVAYVIDGDTVVTATGEHVRFWGINAPELSEPDGSGVDARDYMLALVGAANYRMSCEYKHLDKYGRTVARCYLDDNDLACTMIAAGQAEEWRYFSHGVYKKCRP